jgi:hypothetical protein
MSRTNGQQPNPRDLNDQEHRHATERQARAGGQQLQQEQMRGMLQNPEVLEMLLLPSLSNDPTSIGAALSPHFHIDEVLSFLSDDDIWRKSWDAKIIETRTRMSYPPPESHSPDERVRDVQQRIHGYDRGPLRPGDKEDLSARVKQKADRARRAADGRTVELLLSQVVDVGEQHSDDGNDGLLSGWLGGDS